MEALMTMLMTFVGSPGVGETAGTGILGIWQLIIDFIMASGNELALLGVFAWLFITGLGSLRRLVTGI